MFRPCSLLANPAALAASLFLACTCSTAAEYTIDSGRTGVSFEMNSLGTVQRGEFRGTAGKVELDVHAGSGRLDIVIDARSVETGSEGMKKLLRGPALLNVRAYPQIAYKAQHIVFTEGEPARIEGELTLLGVTQVVPLAVTRYDCTNQEFPARERCSMVATARFKRSSFGMTSYRLLAKDEVELAIHAEGVRVLPDRPLT